MLSNGNIWLGTSSQGPVELLPSMANRHGLIAGATGTGKTVTLQVLAEGFSQLGVPASPSAPARSRSGTCTVKRAIRCAPLSAKWARCSWPGCWV